MALVSPVQAAAEPAEGQASAPAAAPARPPTPQEISLAKESARRLFDEGERRFAAGDYAGAFEAFVQADERFHALTIVLRQARSKAKLKALLKARALYQRVIDEELPTGAPTVLRRAKEEAKSELAALQERIPSVTIVLMNAPPDTRVSIDGTDIPAASLGRPVDQDPGAYVIAALTKGGQAVSKTVELTDGEKEVVELELPKPKASPPPSPQVDRPLPIRAVKSPPARPALVGKPADNARKGATIGAFAVGCAGVTMALATGGFWIYKDKAIRSECDGDKCPLSLASDIDTAKTTGRLAVAALVLGGFGLGTGAAMIVLENKHRGSEKKTLIVSPGYGGVTLTGSF